MTADVRAHLTLWWLKAGYFLLTGMFTVFTIVYAWTAFQSRVAGQV